MSNETITHEGVITKISDSELEINILAKSACAACHAQSACSMSDMKEKRLTVPRPKNQDFDFQFVIVYFRDNAFVCDGFVAHNVCKNKQFGEN